MYFLNDINTANFRKGRKRGSKNKKRKLSWERFGFPSNKSPLTIKGSVGKAALVGAGAGATLGGIAGAPIAGPAGVAVGATGGAIEGGLRGAGIGLGSYAIRRRIREGKSRK